MVFGLLPNPFSPRSSNMGGGGRSFDSAIRGQGGGHDIPSTVHPSDYYDDDVTNPYGGSNAGRRSILRRRYYGHGRGRDGDRSAADGYRERRNYDHRTVSWSDTLDTSYDEQRSNDEHGRGGGGRRRGDTLETNDDDDDDDDTFETYDARDDNTLATDDYSRDDDRTLETGDYSSPSRDDDTFVTTTDDDDDDDDDVHDEEYNDDGRRGDVVDGTTDTTGEDDDDVDDLMLDFDSIYPGDTKIMSHGQTWTYSEARSLSSSSSSSSSSSGGVGDDTMISISDEDDVIEIEHVNADRRVRSHDVGGTRRTPPEEEEEEEMRSTPTTTAEGIITTSMRKMPMMKMLLTPSPPPSSSSSPPPPIGPTRPSERKKLVPMPTVAPSKKTTLFAPVTRGTKKPERREAISPHAAATATAGAGTAVQLNSRLECASTASEATLDKYKGMIEEDDMMKAIGNDNAAIGPHGGGTVGGMRPENAFEPSRVFVPKLIDLALDELVIDDVSTMDSGGTLESSSNEEVNNLDDIHDDTPAGTDPVLPTSKTERYSFDSLPSWDESRIHAGSDETSMVSLSKRNDNYDDMFKIQKRADTLAAHIGLILPFWGRRTGGKDDPPSKKSTLSGEGTDKLTATKDSISCKMPLPSPAKSLQSNASTHPSRDSGGKMPHSENNSFDDVKILPSQSVDGAQSDNGGCIEDSGSMNDDVRVLERDEEQGPIITCNVSSSDARGTSTTHHKIIYGKEISVESLKKKKKSINEFDIKDDHDMQDGHEPNMKEASRIGDAFDVDDFVPSDSSSGVQSNSEESEISSDGVKPTDELIPIQSLGVSKKYTKRNGYKTSRSIQTQTGDDSIPPHLRDDFMDQITLDILNMNNRHKSKEKKKQWSWAWKMNSKKDDRCSVLNAGGRHHPTPDFHRSYRVSDKYDPRELPLGKVNDDDYSCSASCVSVDSILTELKVIEDTAKLMYQKVILGDSGEMGPSQNYIAALFSPEETELVLKTKDNVKDDSKCEQPAHHQDETKRGGMFSKILGKGSSKKTRKFGPAFGVTATWIPK